MKYTLTLNNYEFETDNKNGYKAEITAKRIPNSNKSFFDVTLKESFLQPDYIGYNYNSAIEALKTLEKILVEKRNNFLEKAKFLDEILAQVNAEIVKEISNE